MNKAILTIIKKAIRGAAVASSESTSLACLYQVKTPKVLIKPENKKTK